MTDRDFSGRHLVVGDLIGLRAFRVDDTGQLRGVTFEHPFEPGVNTAVCRRHEGMHATLITSRPARHWWQRRRRVVHQATFYPPGVFGCASGQVAGEKCSCGFYAYTDSTQRTFMYGRRQVSAVVRGFGTCTVGTKGFRAEKAELVALVVPRLSIRDRGLLGAAFCAAVAVWCLIVGLTTADLVPALINGALAGLNAVCAITNTRSALGEPDLRRMRRRYADVPTYRSVAAALEAHPLTGVSR